MGAIRMTTEGAEPTYLRLVHDAGAASVHNTIPLKRAFGMADPGASDVRQVDLSKVVQPVHATWSGKKSDVIQGNVGYRTGDPVVSEAFYARLAGAHLAPHVEVNALCAKADKWGLRVAGPEVPHRWLAFTQPDDLLNDVDWQRSTFVLRESVFGATPTPCTFRDRASFEDAARAAADRLAYVDFVTLVWTHPARAALDVFTMPRMRVDALYVSERIALALLRPPKLRGFRLVRFDGASHRADTAT